MTEQISSFRIVDTFSDSKSFLKDNTLKITGKNHRIGINSSLSAKLRDGEYCKAVIMTNDYTGEVALVFTKDKNAQGHFICFRSDAKSADINSVSLSRELKRLFKCPTEGNAIITLKQNTSKNPNVMFFIIEDIKSSL